MPSNKLNKIKAVILVIILAGFGHAASTHSAISAEDPVWPELKEDLFGDRKIIEDNKFIAMQAPYRAHDAALVPIQIQALKSQLGGQHIKAITLVIDNNPAPVAAVFHLTPEAGDVNLQTRIRINQYSHVRAIAETSDGKLYMVAKYVKASGGCSAPALKNMDQAVAQMGRMKLKQFGTRQSKKQNRSYAHEAQLMIRHPNYSGLQVNQVTGYYIPAHFVNHIEVKVDGKLLMRVEGAISLSEDPVIRFNFLSKRENAELSVDVKDTEDKLYKKRWVLSPPNNSGS